MLTTEKLVELPFDFPATPISLMVFAPCILVLTHTHAKPNVQTVLHVLLYPLWVRDNSRDAGSLSHTFPWEALPTRKIGPFASIPLSPYREKGGQLPFPCCVA